MVDLDEALMLIDEAEARGVPHVERLRALVEEMQKMPRQLRRLIVDGFPMGRDATLNVVGPPTREAIGQREMGRDTVRGPFLRLDVALSWEAGPTAVPSDNPAFFSDRPALT